MSVTSGHDLDDGAPAAREITTVLIANRGEIARRVARTCHDLGLGTVAVYSDADAGSAHAAEADAAVRLPGSAPHDTYLRADLLVAAALRAGADAVHPGYGFLSENAGFARAVRAAGLTWIGPPAEAIEAMGSKVEAKRLMAAAGVPVLADIPAHSVTERDLPVLIKASAGGGGRGMRIVRALDDLPHELDLARAEAGAAFGDATVFCERYLPTGRHIEVQVMADAFGTVWTIGERECSIQRRHQKVIEEAPSPLVQRVDGMRAALMAAARAATTAIHYTGAGTVEFLATEDGSFYFLEMNTRLQVEHPVTEAITGLDLVALQLHVAGGGRLDAAPPAARGHAIEARLYAEDPAAGWRPQSGTLHRLHVPGVTSEFGTATTAAGLRLDSGVCSGARVGTHYDPLLAKIVSWAPTRVQAARTLARTLAGSQIHGVATNRDLLVNVLRHSAFLAGDTDTAFFERHGMDALAAPLAGGLDEVISALAAALALDSAARAEAPVLRSVASGWRNVVSQPQRIDFTGRDGRLTVSYRLARGVLHAEGFDGVDLVHCSADEVVLTCDGVRRRFSVCRYDEHVYVDSALGPVRLTAEPRFPDPVARLAPGSLLAPMPGTIAQVDVAVGDAVAHGRPILLLEAMKMRHRIEAPADGVIAELLVRQGQQVELGEVLAVVVPAQPEHSTDPANAASPDTTDRQGDRG